MTDAGQLRIPFSLRGLGGLTPRVQAIAGFSWGFTVTGPDLSLAPPAVLGPGDWDGHLALLRAGYPGWTFDAGFRPA